jgi:membrane protease YdiL (CAAX protease family)
MSNPQNNSRPPATARAPQTWDFVETAFVALIAYGVFALTGRLGAYIILLMTQDDVQKLSPTQFQELATQGRWYGAALIIACPPTLAVLWVAIRMAGREFAEYLALNWPTPKELALAFVVAAGWIVAEIALLPYEPPATTPFVVGGAAGGLFVLLVGGCLAGPIMEEFVLRGFMFRGWSESFLGPVGAIVLTSALFGLYHIQYDWLGRFWIFLFGLVLCTFRWRSNSTWLTAVVHSAVNIFLLFLSGPYV